MELKRIGASDRTGNFLKRDLGDILITDWDSPPVEGMRSAKNGRGGEEALMLFTASAGKQVLETAYGSAVLQPGTVLLASTSGPCKFVIPHFVRKKSVRMPLSALVPFLAITSLPDSLILRTGDSPLVQLLQDLLRGIDREYTRMSPSALEGARNAMLALIAGLVLGNKADIGGSDFLPMLRPRLEQWISEHLQSSALRVEDIAAAHNVSPRTVQRAFASTGDTVRSVVRTHRLAAVRRDLITSQQPVAAIAHRWGFFDASHLSRTFKQEFTMTPGEFRESYKTTAPATPDRAPIGGGVRAPGAGVNEAARSTGLMSQASDAA
ncbi:helix-turn-helix domain-containing protein [Arthrobacter sp. MI7-26]|uniref:helix-turn-helix domain-containing protein n=1 Tax=Arthrobacter sp. MI7-26 TaxID=2993653 RepID=UPI0022487A97|nr:helix-turn-helix domain-containing protein [Arthrobacter sp. MI7-26]MCX2749828.1 helix-turn-helix domain-containing protein [Arthrobacter sp. MI7-26]